MMLAWMAPGSGDEPQRVFHYSSGRYQLTGWEDGSDYRYRPREVSIGSPMTRSQAEAYAAARGLVLYDETTCGEAPARRGTCSLRTAEQAARMRDEWRAVKAEQAAMNAAWDFSRHVA